MAYTEDWQSMPNTQRIVTATIQLSTYCNKWKHFTEYLLKQAWLLNTSAHSSRSNEIRILLFKESLKIFDNVCLLKRKTTCTNSDTRMLDDIYCYMTNIGMINQYHEKEWDYYLNASKNGSRNVYNLLILWSSSLSVILHKGNNNFFSNSSLMKELYSSMQLAQIIFNLR